MNSPSPIQTSIRTNKYCRQDIQVLSEIVSIAEIKAEKASSSIDLIALLAACSDVSKKYQIDPHKDSFYYRALLRMSLNAKESNWWEKLKQDINRQENQKRSCQLKKSNYFTGISMHCSSPIPSSHIISVSKSRRNKLYHHLKPDALSSPLNFSLSFDKANTADMPIPFITANRLDLNHSLHLKPMHLDELESHAPECAYADEIDQVLPARLTVSQLPSTFTNPVKATIAVPKNSQIIQKDQLYLSRLQIIFDSFLDGVQVQKHLRWCKSYFEALRRHRHLWKYWKHWIHRCDCLNPFHTQMEYYHENQLLQQHWRRWIYTICNYHALLSKADVHYSLQRKTKSFLEWKQYVQYVHSHWQHMHLQRQAMSIAKWKQYRQKHQQRRNQRVHAKAYYEKKLLVQKLQCWAIFTQSQHRTQAQHFHMTHFIKRWKFWAFESPRAGTKLVRYFQTTIPSFYFWQQQHSQSCSSFPRWFRHNTHTRVYLSCYLLSKLHALYLRTEYYHIWRDRTRQHLKVRLKVRALHRKTVHRRWKHWTHVYQLRIQRRAKYQTKRDFFARWKQHFQVHQFHHYRHEKQKTSTWIQWKRFHQHHHSFQSFYPAILQYKYLKRWREDLHGTQSIVRNVQRNHFRAIRWKMWGLWKHRFRVHCRLSKLAKQEYERNIMRVLRNRIRYWNRWSFCRSSVRRFHSHFYLSRAIQYWSSFRVRHRVQYAQQIQAQEFHALRAMAFNWKHWIVWVDNRRQQKKMTDYAQCQKMQRHWKQWSQVVNRQNQLHGIDRHLAQKNLVMTVRKWHKWNKRKQEDLYQRNVADLAWEARHLRLAVRCWTDFVPKCQEDQERQLKATKFCQQHRIRWYYDVWRTGLTFIHQQYDHNLTAFPHESLWKKWKDAVLFWKYYQQKHHFQALKKQLEWKQKEMKIMEFCQIQYRNRTVVYHFQLWRHKWMQRNEQLQQYLHLRSRQTKARFWIQWKVFQIEQKQIPKALVFHNFHLLRPIFAQWKYWHDTQYVMFQEWKLCLVLSRSQKFCKQQSFQKWKKQVHISQKLGHLIQSHYQSSFIQQWAHCTKEKCQEQQSIEWYQVQLLNRKYGFWKRWTQHQQQAQEQYFILQQSPAFPSKASPVIHDLQRICLHWKSCIERKVWHAWQIYSDEQTKYNRSKREYLFYEYQFKRRWKQWEQLTKQYQQARKFRKAKQQLQLFTAWRSWRLTFQRYQKMVALHKVSKQRRCWSKWIQTVAALRQQRHLDIRKSQILYAKNLQLHCFRSLHSYFDHRKWRKQQILIATLHREQSLLSSSLKTWSIHYFNRYLLPSKKQHEPSNEKNQTDHQIQLYQSQLALLWYHINLYRIVWKRWTVSVKLQKLRDRFFRVLKQHWLQARAHYHSLKASLFRHWKFYVSRVHQVDKYYRTIQTQHLFLRQKQYWNQWQHEFRCRAILQHSLRSHFYIPFLKWRTLNVWKVNRIQAQECRFRAIERSGYQLSTIVYNTNLMKQYWKLLTIYHTQRVLRKKQSLQARSLYEDTIQHTFFRTWKQRQIEAIESRRLLTRSWRHWCLVRHRAVWWKKFQQWKWLHGFWHKWSIWTAGAVTRARLKRRSWDQWKTRHELYVSFQTLRANVTRVKIRRLWHAWQRSRTLDSCWRLWQGRLIQYRLFCLWKQYLRTRARTWKSHMRRRLVTQKCQGARHRWQVKTLRTTWREWQTWVGSCKTSRESRGSLRRAFHHWTDVSRAHDGLRRDTRRVSNAGVGHFALQVFFRHWTNQTTRLVCPPIVWHWHQEALQRRRLRHQTHDLTHDLLLRRWWTQWRADFQVMTACGSYHVCKQRVQAIQFWHAFTRAQFVRQIARGYLQWKHQWFWSRVRSQMVLKHTWRVWSRRCTMERHERLMEKHAQWTLKCRIPKFWHRWQSRWASHQCLNRDVLQHWRVQVQLKFQKTQEQHEVIRKMWIMSETRQVFRHWHDRWTREHDRWNRACDVYQVQLIERMFFHWSAWTLPCSSSDQYSDDDDDNQSSDE